MSWPRAVPPAHSPLSARALARGVAAALGVSDPRALLESVLRTQYHADEAVLCRSGTDALARAIRLASSLAGGPAVVALPGYACFDVASAAVGARARVLFYDLDPATLAPDPDSLLGALRTGARVVVVASLYGLPYDWEEIERLCAPFGATIVEDAAQGHGAGWRGEPLGSLAPLAVLSFGRGKGWTGGGGGALLLRSTGVEAEREREGRGAPGARPAAELRTILSTLAQLALGRPALFGVPRAVPWLHIGETRYRPPVAAAAMPRAAAAIALETLEASRRERAERIRRAEWLLARLGRDIRRVTPVAGGEAGFLRLPVRRIGESGAQSLSTSAGRAGVARAYPRTLASLPSMRARSLGPAARLPGAECLARELVTLPTHSAVEPLDLEAVLAAVGPSVPRGAHGVVPVPVGAPRVAGEPAGR